MCSLLNKPLILVTGKGGVGRSTISACIARAAAQSGKNVLLFTGHAMNPFSSIFPQTTLCHDPRTIEPHLDGILTNATDALREYGLIVLRFKWLYKLLFENRITKQFLRAIPGLDDYSILGKCWYHSEREHRWDTIVFDMPASGHALSMLRLPFVISKTLPDSPLRREAKDMAAFLVNPDKTAITLVSIAEELSVTETQYINTNLHKDLNRMASLIIANQIYPHHMDAESEQERHLRSLARQTHNPLAPIFDYKFLLEKHSTMNQTHLKTLHALPVSTIELPRLFEEESVIIERLTDNIKHQLF